MKPMRLVVCNTVFGVVLYCLWREGLPQTAWANDVLYIVPAIALCWAAGMALALRRSRYAGWCAEACVMLGLAGTVYGIFTAFSGIDPAMVGDINSVGVVLGVLLTGLGAALWTTLAGIFATMWLSLHMELCDA